MNPSALLLIGYFLISLTGAAFAQPLQPASSAETASMPVSSAAENVWATVRPSLLQVRTVVAAAGRQSSVGSGFLVSADGLAITNYHVVSDYALEPDAYRLEFARPDGTHGTLKLLMIDIADDLAVVKLEGTRLAHLDFDQTAVADNLPRGERLYAMGNPLDLGFTIVEGTYNGLVERSYIERMHFTGAINPGMSGGPVVTGNGKAVGVNVAKRLDGELVSFLVPASKAAALLERARKNMPLTLAQTRAEIGRQLLAWQDAFYRALQDRGFHMTRFGPYQAPESAAPWFDCWARTNAEDTPKPRIQMDRSVCTSQNSLFIAGDLESGRLELSHTYVRSVDRNAFQFAQNLSRNYRAGLVSGPWSRKRNTRKECRQAFVTPSSGTAAPVLLATWCAQAYRDFADIYDVTLVAVTQDRAKEALVSRLSMQGVSYDTALALGKRFMGSITWTK